VPARVRFGGVAERRDDGPALIPIRELIGVVAAAELARLSGRNEENGIVPIGGIGDEAH